MKAAADHDRDTPTIRRLNCSYNVQLLPARLPLPDAAVNHFAGSANMLTPRLHFSPASDGGAFFLMRLLRRRRVLSVNQ